MSRLIEEPTTEPSGNNMSETVTKHPAFALIGASRVQGSTNLYDSDFRHNHYMTITIRASELHRSLNRDWHFGRNEIIEVALTESQWATFVSAPNMGSGVPCTLQYLQGKVIPGLPDPVKRTDQFAAEIKKKLADSLASIDKALEEIAATGLSKPKQERLAGAFKAARGALQGHLPFIAEQFDEHMENTVEKAKQEVHGYMTNVLQRTGLDAIAKGALPLQITDESRKD